MSAPATNALSPLPVITMVFTSESVCALSMASANCLMTSAFRALSACGLSMVMVKIPSDLCWMISESGMVVSNAF